MISLPSLFDFSALEKHPEFGEAVALAKRYPKARIFITAYVTDADTVERKTDAKSLSDLVIVEFGRWVVQRGIAAERVSGIGMGIDPAIGRKLIFALHLPEGG